MADRLPPWTEEELILAVDLYVTRDQKQLRETDPDLIALSEVLTTISIHEPKPANPKFRNPAGVRRKLADIHTVSPGYAGKPTRGNKLDQLVLDAYLADPKAYRARAELLRGLVGDDLADPSTPVPGLDDTHEGGLLLRRHYRRERNTKLVAKKKAEVMAKTGKLECEACLFDFAVVYGQHGEGFIECHHKVPLTESGPTKTKPADLALLCSNCHRMVHRHGLVSIEELKAKIKLPSSPGAPRWADTP